MSERDNPIDEERVEHNIGNNTDSHQQHELRFPPDLIADMENVRKKYDWQCRASHTGKDEDLNLPGLSR